MKKSQGKNDKNPIFRKLWISNSSFPKVSRSTFLNLGNQENSGKTAGKSLGSFIFLDKKKKIPGKIKKKKKKG